MPRVHKVWKTNKKLSKKSSRKQSKKVSFKKRMSKKQSYKKSNLKNSQSLLSSKNNMELSTYDMNIPMGSKKQYSYIKNLIKEQPLQTLKLQFQSHNECLKSSQNYNFINILRGVELEKLFSYVPTPYTYVATGATSNPVIYDTANISTTRPFVHKDYKVYIKNLKIDFRIKSSCNVAQNVKVYILKPRYDINYISRKFYAAGGTTQQALGYYNIEDFYEQGILDNNNLRVVPSAQTNITGKTVGITPYESCYLTKNFKILNQYTRNISLSNGGNIDMSINLPYNKVVSYDRLQANYLNDGNNALNKWIKGISLVIMVVYYGDQGINVSTANPAVVTMDTMPCSNLQLIDYKIDFNICNDIKAKINQYGSINVPVGGTDKTMDENGNIITYSTINTGLA